MKTVWARISMELEVSDEEYEQLRGNRLLYNSLIPDELAKRFIENGKLSDDSYIPADIYDGYKVVISGGHDDGKEIGIYETIKEATYVADDYYWGHKDELESVLIEDLDGNVLDF